MMLSLGANYQSLRSRYEKQMVRRYNNRIALDITSKIENMIELGWNVVSMVSVNENTAHGSRTDYIIVVYEKE